MCECDFIALTLLVGLQEWQWWDAGVVICPERGADLHMAQLPLTVSYFSKIHIGFTFLVLAHPGSPGQSPESRKMVVVVVVVVVVPCEILI